jgi:sugar O-acyltransferase (sialic acid O-acetyltransferase NeuD family)
MIQTTTAGDCKRLVIVGAGEFAEIAYEYFTRDSPYEVVAFSVESDYLDKSELFGLPVVPFENLHQTHQPSQNIVFVAVTYTQLNRVRTRLYRAAKARGYRAASYISSHAFVWHDVHLGENCFVFENNVVQYHARLGDNVILWSGNHIGHRAVIGDNCFVSSQVVVSGYCEIGESCFLGVNCTIADRLKIARDCFIGAGAVIVKNTVEARIYRGNPAVAANVSSLRAFQVREEA